MLNSKSFALLCLLVSAAPLSAAVLSKPALPEQELAGASSDEAQQVIDSGRQSSSNAGAQERWNGAQWWTCTTTCGNYLNGVLVSTVDATDQCYGYGVACYTGTYPCRAIAVCR